MKQTKLFNKLIVLFTLTSFNCMAIKTPSQSPLEAELKLNNEGCTIAGGEESIGSALANILIPKLVKGGLKKLGTFLSNKALEEKEIAAGHYGNFFYTADEKKDDDGVYISLNNKCFAVKVSDSRREIELTGGIEFATHDASFRFVPEKLIFKDNKKRAKQLRNIEFLFTLSIPDPVDGKKVISISPLSFLKLNKNENLIETYFAEKPKNSLWMPVPSVPVKMVTTVESFNNLISTKLVKEEDIKQRWYDILTVDSIQTEQPIDELASKKEVSEICGTESNVNSKFISSSSLLSKESPPLLEAIETENKKTKPSLELIQTSKFKLIKMNDELALWNACKGLININKKETNLTEILINPRVPFDLTVQVFETVDKPVLKFFAEVFNTETQNQIADVVTSKYTQSGRDLATSAALTEFSTTLEAKDKVYQAIKVAELQIIVYQQETDPIEKRKEEIDMNYKKWLANKAAMLANIDLPYPALSM